MYINPTFLPMVSNREDFILTVQVFDDDTFEPIDLANSATANMQSFTGSAWTVRDGAITTTSTTTITIPPFPIGDELNALALTIGVGLAIKPGDPIQIADTPTGLNTMNGYCVSYASATGKLVVQIGWTFEFEVRPLPPNWVPGYDYTSWYDVGVAPQQPILKASLAAGTIFVTDLGTLEIRIPESTFKTLRSGTYGIGMTMTDSVNTRQLFIGRLPVGWGMVSS